VNAVELGFTLVLAAILVGLAIYFGRRQLQTLRSVAAPDSAKVDERRYLRTQAYRRLLCSGLMLLFAGFLLGWIVLDGEYREVREQVRAAQATEAEPQLTEEQKEFVRVFSTYWIVALLVLLVLVALAALDFWATARYGLSQHRRLQADHRDLIRQDVAQRRRERNGNS
jgi:MFS family permease